MDVTYLTIEDIESGLFQTQVLDILTEIAIQEPQTRFEVILVNRPWLLRSHLRKKKKIEKYLHQSIKLKYFPLLPPLRNAMSSVFYSAAVTEWLRFIYWLVIPKKSDILHCRSYWSTQAALKSKNVPVLFDMRSLWPIENMSMGLLKENSTTATYWLNLEKKCLFQSAVSAGVSKAMIVYSKEVAPESDVRLIPISVDKEKYKFNSEQRSEKRNLLKWQDNIVLVYSGSFGQSNINLKALRTLFEALLSADPSVRLLFLTMEKDHKVNELMQLVAGSDGRFQIVHPSLPEIGSWLSACDIGVHALPKQLDFATRLGTKVVEYWINGLPVIVNEHVGAAAELITENNIGSVFYDDASYNQQQLSVMIKNLVSMDRDQVAAFADMNFSTRVTARLYLEAYNVCLTKSNFKNN